MLPTDFKEANQTLGKPDTMTDEQCCSLRAFIGTYPDGRACIISKWQPSREDIDAINRGEGIYLEVTGTATPPISIYTENPFKLNDNG